MLLDEFVLERADGAPNSAEMVGVVNEYRAIIEAITNAIDTTGEVPPSFHGRLDRCRINLRQCAQPYRDHPDFQSDWY